VTGSRTSALRAAGCFAVATLVAGLATAQPPNGPSTPATAPPAPVFGGVPLHTQPLAAPDQVPVPPFTGPQPAPQPPRFNFKIGAKTPIKELLPTAPKSVPITGPVLTDELAKIPEVEFQARPAKVVDDEKMTQQAAYQLAKITHANAKKTDAFMTALLENRPDLAGMPFAMGDDCRATGPRVQYFTKAAETVRAALGVTATAVMPATTPTVSTRTLAVPVAQAVAVPPSSTTTPLPTSTSVPAPTLVPQQVLEQTLVVQGTMSATANLAPAQAVNGQSFWPQYTTLCDQEDAARTRPDKETTELVTLARLAALTQILAAESPEIRLGLVKYLTGVPHVEATKALARMAIYSAENDIRDAAITALKVRREKDYTSILVKGLRYQWPAVAKRAAEAIAKLERSDLIPELVAVLDSDDPRLPETKEVDGKVVVREMVKLNHHRNCMMCHTSSGSGTPNPNALSAEVAIQGQPLPSPGEGYRQSTPELMIRIDVTYLRPDFSVAMPVKDAHPWPEMQRFDFLVRERKLTTDEAVSYREQLAIKEPGVLSPYHKAALAALRDMTGKDTAPTAEAWRKLLDLPKKD
jgi:hypothetical protein